MATATARKKTTRKKKASTKKGDFLEGSGLAPEGVTMPEGMKRLGSSNAPTWKPENPGDHVMGQVTGPVKIVEFTQKRKVKGKMVEETVERQVFELTTEDGVRYSIWESAALTELFEELTEEWEGRTVFLQYDGLGKKKAGQHPPKLFTVAISE